MNALDVLFEAPLAVVHYLTMTDWKDYDLALEALRRQDVRDQTWRIYQSGEANFLKAALGAGFRVKLDNPGFTPLHPYKVPVHWLPAKE